MKPQNSQTLFSRISKIITYLSMYIFIFIPFFSFLNPRISSISYPSSLNSHLRSSISRSQVFGKKGFGDVASTLILFIAIIGVSTGLVIAIKNYAVDTQRSFELKNEVISNQIKTAVDIINVNYDSSTNQTYIYLKNIGKTKLQTADFDMFIDDEYIINYSVYYADNLSKNLTLLGIQDTAAFVKEKYLASGSHKVKLVSEYGGNGDEEYFNN